VKRQGSDLLENLLVHFEVDLKVERDDDKDADELTRRIARQMRAAGKQDEELRTLEKGHFYHPENPEILSELKSARARVAKQS